MSDFFSPLEEDQVTRTQQDEDEERIAEAVRAKAGPGPKVFGLWNPESRAVIAAGGLTARVLVVAAGARACDLLAAPTLSRRQIGALTVSGITARGVSANPSHEDNTGVVYAFENHPDVLLVAARYDVPPERAREWAKSLADAVQPSECTVVVAAVDERDVDRGSDGYRGAYALDTTTMRRKGAESGAESGAEVRRIPPGTLVEGIAAATMARSEATGRAARLVAVPAPSANRAGTARGPGFGGGIDPHAAAHAVRMVMEVSGLDFGVGEGEASDAFVGDDMRVYV